MVVNRKAKKTAKLKCREVFQCKSKECPAYGSKSRRCWLISADHYRGEIQKEIFEKMELCIQCKVFRANMDVTTKGEVVRVVKKLFKEFLKIVEERDKELENVSMELALSLSEVFEALKKISSGDPTIRVHEKSKVELITKLRHMVNVTAENIGEIIDQFHEVAIGLAEYFDVLHRVSKGDLNAKVTGISGVELLESLKRVTNETIGSISREISERERAQGELQKARDELEHRVEERTAELSTINERLKTEIEIRKLAEKEVKKLNRELQVKITELTGVNKELDSFNYSVSHDLKTPLIVINGFIRRFLKVYGNKLDTKGMEMLGIIRENTQKMEMLIQDLLTFSRSSRHQIQPAHIRMGDLVTTVLNEIKPLTERRIVRFDIKPLPPAYGDEILIKQVFSNLLSNAVKFTGTKSEAVIEVGHRDEEKENVYYVKDNGIGFDPTDTDRLFSLFHRLRGAEKFEGTGVGLSIVARIINRHGGRVWAEGRPDEGATFYFSLPKENGLSS